MKESAPLLPSASLSFFLSLLHEISPSVTERQGRERDKEGGRVQKDRSSGSWEEKKGRRDDDDDDDGREAD